MSPAPRIPCSEPSPQGDLHVLEGSDRLAAGAAFVLYVASLGLFLKLSTAA